MSLCFNIFSLPRCLLCDCAGRVPSRLFCERVKYLCIALVMCFGDAPVVNASLLLLSSPLVSSSLLCLSFRIISGFSPLFYDVAFLFLSHALLLFLIALLHHGRATALCTSSPMVKAIHFSGLFENRLLDFTAYMQTHTIELYFILQDPPHLFKDII